MPRPSVRCLLTVGLGLLACACAGTAADHRQAIEATTQAWQVEVLPETQEELLEHVRDLADLGRKADDWLQNLTLLNRQALENLSALVRAESLLAAWRLAADLPTDIVPAQDLPLERFQERLRRFSELHRAADPATHDELLQLAEFLANYRFAPSADPRLRRLPLDLSETVVGRATFEEDEALRRIFAAGAEGSVRHALSLVTLHSADDRDPAVRQAALTAARHLDPAAALNLIAGALTVEVDTQVLLAAVQSLSELSPDLGRREVLATLSQVGPGSDLALRRAADALAARVGQ